MKKLISLLLALVLTLGLLSGVTLALNFEKPDECSQAEAVLKVTDKNGDSYYFPEFNTAVFHWARKEITGEKTVTLLKDVTVTEGDHSQRVVEFSGNLADWAGRNGTKNPITFDLGGNTLSYEGESALFYCNRFGFTLKNGTVKYTSKGRSLIAVGSSTGSTAISSGGTSLNNLYQPKINLEDVTLITAGGSCLLNQVWGSQISIKDSTLISNGTVLNLLASDQSGLSSSAKPYEGNFTATVNIENSTLTSAKNYAVNVTREEYTVNISDSLVVSNGKTADMVNPEAKFTLDTKGQDPVVTENWSATLADKAVSGTAYAIGEAPGAAPVELPFTDVKEGDWFYEFVSEMYGKKIIAGMTETTFVPNGTLTYGQALKLIAVGLGKGEQPAGTHWASGYLDLAKKEGWLANDVDLNGSVTRVAFCQIAAAAKGLTEVGENPFKDTTDLSVLALVKAGVISGMSADTFAPDQTLTRAQIAKIISLLIKL